MFYNYDSSNSFIATVVKYVNLNILQKCRNSTQQSNNDDDSYE